MNVMSFHLMPYMPPPADVRERYTSVREIPRGRVDDACEDLWRPLLPGAARALPAQAPLRAAP